MCYRHIHQSNPAYAVSSFSLITGTTDLQKHLYTEHVEKWVTACDNLKIQITSAAAIQAIRKFCQEPVDTSLESEHTEYSKEAFVEGILHFIVGDDQVSAYFLTFSKINVSLGYQCC